MAGTDDAIGSDMPALSAEQEAAFAAEEKAAAEARTGAKGGGYQRLTPEVDEDGTGGQPAPGATPAPAPAPAATPAPVAAAAPAPAPAPVADEEIEGAVAATDGSRYVPVATHVAQRKTLQGQVADMKAALDRANQLNAELIEIAKKGAPQPAPAAAPAPAPAPEVNPYDKTTHPLEHLEWKNEQLEKQLKGINEWRSGQETQSAQSKALTEARGAYVQLHRGFEAANPNYGGDTGAYRFVMDTWTKVNEALGMTKAQAIAAAEQNEWNVVEQATKANKHPSQVMMSIAEAAGWKPGTAAPAAGATPSPAPAPTPSPAKQIELAQQGAAAAVSLSDASGGAAPAPLSLAQLTALPKEEFYAKFSGAKGEQEFQRLAMGKKSTLVA